MSTMLFNPSALTNVKFIYNTLNESVAHAQERSFTFLHVCNRTLIHWNLQQAPHKHILDFLGNTLLKYSSYLLQVEGTLLGTREEPKRMRRVLGSQRL
jgi:hypothetical protein